MTRQAFAGIDVAFAKKKRLPVVVAVHRDGALVPLPLRQASAKPPAGEGNARSLDDAVLTSFADQTVVYLRTIEHEFDVRIRSVAIDAPSGPKMDYSSRRHCEIALDLRRISCITTPSQSEFEFIKTRALAHLESGGSQARMPAANQLWMLVGFALFKRLRSEWDCFEVFPQAIAAALGASRIHKSKAEGLRAQLSAAAAHTGWPFPPEPLALKPIGHGPAHDLLDAYLSAWVASLPVESREPLGLPPNDVIWLPRLRPDA